MHGALAFVAGICTAIGAFLIVFALSGVTYYGITPQTQLGLALVAIIIATIAVWMLYFALKARDYKIQTGKEALIGSVGRAVTDLTPNGTIRVLGEFWQATTKERTIKEDTTVKVVALEGMFLVVETTEEKA
jgi:membrane-bound serine protease (ClpP class)